MWAANSSATLRAVADEQEESAERARVALGLTLANQVARGCAPDELIVEEYRAAVLESKAARSAHSYDTTPAAASSEPALHRRTA